ncbi:MAG TPA: DUF2062 domain-containing protein [Chthoniobacterales bacterium]|jgi:uncharacterized protein (DUF2062 family)
MNPISWIRTNAGRLVRLKDPPHAIAIGVAVGMFFGLIPLWGLKTLLAMGVTRLLRGNVVAAAIAATLHDVALPIVPLLLRWEYDLGYWLLSHPHALPPRLHLSHQNPAIWFHWSTFFTIGQPLLLGSFVVAAPVSIVTYFLTLALVKRWRRNRPSSPDG